MAPERPIEKLLRSWAKKRRQDAGPPPDLHPATRRLLQSEAARKFRKNEGKAASMSGRFVALWPRFAWGLGVFAVLVVAGWLLLPPLQQERSKDNLASYQKASEAAPARRYPATPAMEPAAVPAKKDDRADRNILAENSPAPMNKELGRGNNEPLAAGETALKLKEGSGERNDARGAGLAGVNRDGGALNSPAGSAFPSDQFRPGHEEMTVRPGFAASSPAKAPQPAVAAAPSPAPTGPTGRSSGFRDAVTTSGNAVAPTTAAPPASSVVASAKDGVGNYGLSTEAKRDADQSSLASKSMASAVGSSAVQTRQSFFAGDAKKENSLAMQRFAQVQSAEKTKTDALDKVFPVKSVLTSFELEQLGREVRIVDGDGSVYTGYTDLLGDSIRSRAETRAAEKPDAPAVSLLAAGGKLEQTTPAGSDANVQSGQSYFFRVAGTNRTLNQSVVFTGYLTPATAGAVVNRVTNSLSLAGGAGAAGTEPQEALPPPLMNSRISGKAILGDKKEVEINAVSTDRAK